MSVDTFWRRTPAEDAVGLDPYALAGLVPDWFDEEFDAERGQGILLGVEDTGELIGKLLVLGAGDGPHRDIALALARVPENFHNAAMVGTYGVDVVRQAAVFLADAPLEHWAQQHADALAAHARALGYGRPYTSEWLDSIAHGARELARLMREAAKRNEVVLVRISA